MDVASASALAAKATSTLSRRLGSSSASRQPPVYVSRCFSRSITTATPEHAATQPPAVPASQGQPSAKVRRHRPGPDRQQIRAFDALKRSPYKLAKTYARKLKRGFPMLIRNLPGFLDGQDWIDNTFDEEASFKTTPQKHQIKDPAAGFDLLKLIFESAATGRSRRDLTSTQSANFKAVFDDLEGECRITQAAFEGDNPPLFKFRDWLPQSDFRGYSLDKIIVALQEASCINTLRAEPLPWVPFSAPLAFIRAVHQYNRDQEIATNTVPSSDNGSASGKNHPACITRVNGLVILTDTMTEHFPFPRIMRDIGPSPFQTNIRIGIRPPRIDMRRSKHAFAVIGQLAGHSAVTLVPPRLKLLQGLSLEFHEKLRGKWQDNVTPFPRSPPSFGIDNSIWTRGFQKNLVRSGDLFTGTLRAGSALFVPKGWYYGIRSLSKEQALNASVTWFLSPSKLAIENQEGFAHLRRFPPWVTI
ncbi:hypothetical protein F5B18DRAFT_617840 [Nemania serpens]|nr:hypothetical protein F5B18DRAFT_617840 [Nemania serpens]